MVLNPLFRILFNVVFTEQTVLFAGISRQIRDFFLCDLCVSAVIIRSSVLPMGLSRNAYERTGSGRHTP